MIDYMNLLWSLMTIFFSESVIEFPLFGAMILFNTIFYMIFLLKYIFDTLMRAS